MALAPLPGYPMPIGGGKYMMVATYQGPANYQAPGETVNAPAGWGGIDYVEGGVSFNSSASGLYTVRAFTPAGQSPGVSSGVMSSQIPTGANNVTFQWVYTANHTQPSNAANLATEFARVMFIGS